MAGGLRALWRRWPVRPGLLVGGCTDVAELTVAGRQAKRCHTYGMATYTIIPRVDLLDVAVVSRNGARQTVLGFASKADAEAWIDEDMRLNSVSEGLGPDRRPQ